ncbi:MAG: hypothetical protein ACP5HS_12565 [Anaerolineae bacterium]
MPLYMGESGENIYDWIRNFRSLLETHRIGWSFWTYKRLDTDRCIASILRPEGWNAIVEFAEHPRSTYQEIREQRLPLDVAGDVFEAYLDGLPFRHCQVNVGYLDALGF